MILQMIPQTQLQRLHFIFRVYLRKVLVWLSLVFEFLLLNLKVKYFPQYWIKKHLSAKSFSCLFQLIPFIPPYYFNQFWIILLNSIHSTFHYYFLYYTQSLQDDPLLKILVYLNFPPHLDHLIINQY